MTSPCSNNGFGNVDVVSDVAVVEPLNVVDLIAAISLTGFQEMTIKPFLYT